MNASDYWTPTNDIWGKRSPLIDGFPHYITVPVTALSTATLLTANMGRSIYLQEVRIETVAAQLVAMPYIISLISADGSEIQKLKVAYESGNADFQRFPVVLAYPNNSPLVIASGQSINLNRGSGLINAVNLLAFVTYWT